MKGKILDGILRILIFLLLALVVIKGGFSILGIALSDIVDRYVTIASLICVAAVVILLLVRALLQRSGEDTGKNKTGNTHRK